MMYKPSKIITEKLEVFEPESQTRLINSLAMLNFFCRQENTESRQLHDEFYNTNCDDIPQNARLFSTNDLQKACQNFVATKEELNKLLSVLKHDHVVSYAVQQLPSGGRSKEMRFVYPRWLLQKGQSFDALETALFQVLESSQLKKKPIPKPDLGPLRVLRNFSTNFGGTFMRFTAGQEIHNNYLLVNHLLETNLPVAFLNEKTRAQCDSCFFNFDAALDQSPCENPVLVCLKDNYFWMRGNIIRHKEGDICSDFQITKFIMADGNLPFAVASFDEFAQCPGCKKIFGRAKLLGDAEKTLQAREMVQKSA